MSNNSKKFSKFTKSAPKGVTNSSLFGLNQVKMLLPLNLPRVNTTYFFAFLILTVTNLYLFYKLNTITLEFLALENRINLLNQNIENLISENLKLNTEIKRLILENDKLVKNELLNFKKNILINSQETSIINYRNILFLFIGTSVVIGVGYGSYIAFNTYTIPVLSSLLNTIESKLVRLAEKLLNFKTKMIYTVKDKSGRDFIVEISDKNEVDIFTLLPDNSKIGISDYLHQLITQPVVDNTLSTTTEIVTNVISNLI